MSVSRDRWSCPSCNRTVVVDGSQADTEAAIHAVQERHARGHHAAEQVLARLPLPELPAEKKRQPAPRSRRHTGA